MSFEYPKRVRFVCERCAICCGDTEERVRQVLLLKIEAERISRDISKNIGGFAEKIEGSEPYAYRMKKTEEGKCVFLKDNLCMIYEVRPLICRFYPFQLENMGDNKFAFTYTSECPGIGKGPSLKRNFFEMLFKESAKIIREDAKKCSRINEY
ncbi:MAG: YkgJ family cysteine cluster protein [Candidatus Bathyarchaeia archaeon]